MTVKDVCGTEKTCKIKNTGGKWENIAGMGQSATCHADGYQTCKCSGWSTGICPSTYEIYHHNIGTGGAYEAYWGGKYDSGCSQYCNSGSSSTIGTGGNCGADTLQFSEIPCLNTDCCVCTAYLYYFTCGDDCS